MIETGLEVIALFGWIVCLVLLLRLSTNVRRLDRTVDSLGDNEGYGRLRQRRRPATPFTVLPLVEQEIVDVDSSVRTARSADGP